MGLGGTTGLGGRIGLGGAYVPLLPLPILLSAFRIGLLLPANASSGNCITVAASRAATSPAPIVVLRIVLSLERLFKGAPLVPCVRFLSRGGPVKSSVIGPLFMAQRTV